MFLLGRKWLFFLLCIAVTGFADSKRLSFKLDNADLADAIRMIVQYEHRNVILSPTITGNVTLNLKAVTPAHALHVLLASTGLAKWQADNILYIAPRDELMKYKQAEIKWQHLLEEDKPLITAVWQIKYGKASEIGKILQDEQASLVSKRGKVRVDMRTNLLCIRDVAERLREVDALIKRLDVPVKQILIEARLVSIDHDFERELGFDFSVLSAAQGSKQGKMGATFLNNDRRGYSLAVAKLADGSLLDVKLSALENAGHAELISSPSLFTQNQQTALIEAGEEVPYQEVSEGGGTAVTFKKAVLGLRVTPQVLPGNNVLLHLQINQDRPSTKMVLGVPTISTRQITTSVLVKTGQTVVLGGIYENNQEKTEQGLPFLGKIPLIGWLFKKQNTRTSKRELFIFVTPTIN